MTQPRLSTVYDFSNLRLHPDGTRVYQKSTNLRPDLVKVTTRDSRFNWIAKDAGGSATVPQFRKREQAARKREEDGEVDLQPQEDESTESSQQSSEEGDEPRQDRRKRKPKRIDTRKPKRLKFAKNYSYLESEARPVSEDDTDTAEILNDTIKLPEPSADLLKCIHRFASEFYTERGQLLNISREYRKERKKRALQRRTRRGTRATKSEDREDSAPLSGSESDSSESEAPNQGFDGDSEDEASSESEESGDSDNEGRSGSTNAKGKGKAKPTKPWKRKGRRRAEKLYTDMYKMFDGSAMMALGMLVQEQIAHMLNPEVPEGWEEEMKRYYGDVREDDTDEEEQSIEPPASAEKATPPEEERGSRVRDEAVGPHVVRYANQSGNEAAESRTEQNINENPAHQLDNTPLRSQSVPNFSTTGTEIGSGTEHEVDDADADPIEPWSGDSEENEDSQDDTD